MSHYESYMIGYGFSVLVGHLLISGLMKNLHGPIFGKKYYPTQPKMLGLIERSLYTTSYHIGRPEFIAVWLALKVAGLWRSWTEGENEIPGRTIYNAFLIGSGLSLAYGVLGALLIRWLQSSNLVPAVIWPLTLIIGTIVLWIWAKFQKFFDQPAADLLREFSTRVTFKLSLKRAKRH